MTGSCRRSRLMSFPAVQPRNIADIEAVVPDTLESTPGEDTHRSTRGLAATHGISETTAAEIWRAFGLEPWQQGIFEVSPDPDLIEEVRDLVGLYVDPPEAAAVFAVDERPQLRASDRTAPTLPLLPTTGRLERSARRSAKEPADDIQAWVD